MTIHPFEKLGPVYNLYFTYQWPLLGQMKNGNLLTFLFITFDIPDLLPYIV